MPQASSGASHQPPVQLRLVDIPWPVPSGYGRRHDLLQMTLAWRGDGDPVATAFSGY
ncbi:MULTISPECIES: hypothetical protein [unclassified Streptomyces]|uniref:hypothetical protein n=1 Tax=unclassified Streptomyces TaxID=2593676 RepID=UPI00225A9D75|nr:MULTISPECIES: hypothetical protein [unclassified Streptomyces]MCX4400130.1 hypothetical protein [Streptomyces sp. NBC_01767]